MLIASLLLACSTPLSVEDACPAPRDPPFDTVSADEAAVFDRLSCYRAVAGLPMARFDRKVQEASSNHAKYVQDNALRADQILDLQETPFFESFTGATVLERSEAVGYTYDPENFALWDFVTIDCFRDGVARVDYFFQDPGSREIYLQSDWLDAGYVQGTAAVPGLAYDFSWSYLTLWYSVPRLQTVGNPVIWPVDGQQDVPTAAPADILDPANPDDVGPAISIVFGEDSETGFTEAGSDPYAARWVFAALHDEDGVAVQLDRLEPGDEAQVTFSLAAVPRKPLRADTEYTFDAVVEALGERHTIHTTFQTGKDGATRPDAEDACPEFGFTASGGITTLPPADTGGTTPSPADPTPTTTYSAGP
jgi:hypothetical protein